MADYTSDGLLTAVRDYCQLPTWDEGTSAQLLRLLNREQLLYLTALIQGARKEFRTSTTTVSLSASRTAYQIPARAIASGLKMIQATDSAGNSWMLYQVPAEDVPWPYSWQSPCGQFYIQGNRIVFYSAPTLYSSLLISFPRRMSELVLSTDTTNARAITQINTSTKTVTMAGSIAGSTFDLVQANPQFDLLSADAAGTPAGSTVVFTDALPNDLAVGDYCCVPQKAPVCMAPYELHAVLALRVAYVTLKAKGDPAAEAIKAELAECQVNAMKLLEPRPEKVRALKNPNAPGMVITTSSGWRG